ncbi:MAG: class I SAM-dependent methyltransferase [Rhodocyclaceae bacterium]
MTLLVFPSCIESCLPFVEEARRMGQRVVGASSLSPDPLAAHFDAWAPLPYLQDSQFAATLSALFATHDITALYTAHAPTYHFFSLHPELLGNTVRLIGPGPYSRQSQRVTQAFDGLPARLAQIDVWAGKPAGYSRAFIASLLHQSSQIYGESQTDKILALCAALADAPRGDVIEIGSFFGKSAFVLSRAAAQRQVGPCIAVDSWDMAQSVQHDSPIQVQSLSNVWDWETVFQGFLLATACQAAGTAFNYLRLPSARAWQHYDAARSIDTPEFGRTDTTGRIALLHIDGNHDLAQVRQDFRLWRQRIADGGWLVFDDYHWSHGDGPRLAADEAVRDYGERVTRQFIAGGALFLKLRAAA